MFKVGDKVTWRSQSASVYSNKIGEVVEVIPAGVRPKGIFGAGQSRGHESYIVKAIADTTMTKRSKRYWPRVSLLKPVRQ